MRAFGTVLITMCLACGSQVDDGEQRETTSASSGSEQSSSGTTTRGGAESSTPSGTTMATEAASTSTGASSTGGPSDLPNGAECARDEQCASGHCYPSSFQSELGGICSRCSTDADCEDGTCRVASDALPAPAVCIDYLGMPCTPNTFCGGGFFCAQIYETQGEPHSVCSECATTQHCADPNTVCNVSFDFSSSDGESTCVEIGSVPHGETCNVDADGDLACAGHCAVATLGASATFGICGACRTVDGVAEGCEKGQTCVGPTITYETGVTPSECK